MSIASDAVAALTAPPADAPRRIDPGYDAVDKVFRLSVRSVAAAVLVIFGSIGAFLAGSAIPTFHRYGLKFLTTSAYQPRLNRIGIAGTLLGTAEVAVVALLIAFPLALATAVFISEYAPASIKGFLVGMIDLMAAVPSVIYGIWGVLLLMPHAKYVSRWLAQHFGFAGVFHVHTDPNAAAWSQSQFVGSAFIAGIAVSMMVLPIACSIMRGVFAAAPVGEREGAYALGATRWWMIRTVVLPFGRSGIIGGTMLGLGRALGETVAVLLIVSLVYETNWHILQNGTSTISSYIANNFGDATGVQTKALLTAGLALFILTLIDNTIASVFVSRSRSGAAI